ncbi:MAG: Hsp20/alpha crystallin family protein [Desulfobacteraceae bacterium]|nr:MAG: Hsp20/alpha crystallin family protein [Desulfobacteraceae bacterium]
MRKLMDIIPWKKKKEIVTQPPESTFQSIQSQMDDFFDHAFPGDWITPRRLMQKSQLFPRVDIKEEKRKIIVDAEMPGVRSKDIDLSLDGRMLTIKAHKNDEKEHKTDGYYRLERSYGYYNRTIELPAEVDPVKVDASFKNGVLKVEMKKIKESEAKKIEVKTE